MVPRCNRTGRVRKTHSPRGGCARPAFLAAAYDTFIPADKLSPSGTDCGLVTYMDRQLARAGGGGARLYRGGPFVQGKPEQGYQRPLTPREYFAAGIKAANAWSHKTYGIGALTCWSAKAITEQYLKSPGPLVHA
jgi:hypothetical protein